MINDSTVGGSAMLHFVSGDVYYGQKNRVKRVAKYLDSRWSLSRTLMRGGNDNH